MESIKWKQLDDQLGQICKKLYLNFGKEHCLEWELYIDIQMMTLQVNAEIQSQYEFVPSKYSIKNRLKNQLYGKK